jgi:signal transduction histidine kinase
MGEMLHHIKPSLGARLLKWAGLSFTMSLAVRTVGVATHTDIENIYDPSVDQGVMIVGQFVAVTLSNIAFLRIFLEIAEEKKIALTHELAVTQERAEVMQQTGAELKRLLDEREEIIRQLAIFNKTAGMGALVASLAHELNQPLTAIQLNAEFIDTALQSQRPLDSEDIQDAMQDLMKENQRAASIITTLRNLFGSGKKLITVFSLNALIEDVVLLCQIKLTARNIQLRLNLPTEPLEVAGDKAQMQQVVLNLMTNAIEALEGCDRANPCIDVSLTRVDTSVALTVRDPGAGIPQDVADSVFDLFRTSKDQGMGVGLWLSRTIVESHRGTIRFETRVNEGTTFTVTLPLAIGDMIY